MRRRVMLIALGWAVALLACAATAEGAATLGVNTSFVSCRDSYPNGTLIVEPGKFEVCDWEAATGWNVNCGVVPVSLKGARALTVVWYETARRGASTMSCRTARATIRAYNASAYQLPGWRCLGAGIWFDDSGAASYDDVYCRRRRAPAAFVAGVSYKGSISVR